MTVEEFLSRLEQLRERLVEQGERVGVMIDDAFESLFTLDTAAAAEVAARDDEVDHVDVEIERACVTLMAESAASIVPVEEANVRALLTVVKVNNELERVADAAQRITDRVEIFKRLGAPFPPTLRVMTNSVVGIVRDANRALGRGDARLARTVLQSEDAVENFTAAIMREADEQSARGGIGADFVFHLHEVAHACEVMADHATNIAEQIIYAGAGAIVRHTPEGWKDVALKQR